MEEILSNLPTFPRTLTIDEQGLFVLGYYHQRAADAKARLEHRMQSGVIENGEAGAADAPATEGSASR
jgi:hypothetical protein